MPLQETVGHMAYIRRTRANKIPDSLSSLREDKDATGECLEARMCFGITADFDES